MNDDAPTPVAGAQTLLRALDILDCFTAEQPSWTLAEIMGEVGLTMPTVHRLLRALVQRGVLVNDFGRSYSPGPTVMRLAMTIMHRADHLIRLSSGSMDRLRVRTGETIALYSLVGDERVCIAENVSLQPIRMESGVGNVYPMHAGAAGKILLAWSPERRERVAQRLRGSRKPNLDQLEKFEKDLTAARHDGYAVSKGEIIPGASALAVPVFGPDGSVIAALGVSGPVERWNDAAIAEHIPAVLEEADRIMHLLGAVRPAFTEDSVSPRAG